MSFVSFFRHVSAAEGHLDVLKFLLLQPGIHINASDANDFTPLLCEFSTFFVFLFPASRGLLSFACTGRADEYEKGDPCPGSKLTVLGMRCGYLATESSHDASCCLWAHLTTAELL